MCIRDRPIIYANKFKLLRSLGQIRKTIKQCDIVHALDLFPFGIVAIIASLGLGKKIIITTAGTGSIKPLYRPGIAFFSRWALRRANILTAISHYTAREIQKKVPSLNFTIITPGVAYDYFSKLSPEHPGSVSPETKYILSVGSLVKRKGYHISLPAFKQTLSLIHI